MNIECIGGECRITDFSELEAYKIAIKIEKDGMAFYASLAKQEKNPESKHILDFMVEEERRHLSFFENALEDLRSRLTEEYEDDDLLSYTDYGIFEPYKEIQSLPEVINDVKKALKLGINIERNALRFYEECSRLISSQETKKALADISEEEMKHLETLEKILGND